MNRLEDSVLQRLDYLVQQGEETLDVEFKGPLDLSTEDHKDDLAKSLLAMANHGGGYVIIGVDAKQRKQSAATGANLPTHDDIIRVVSSYADPTFHCNVHKISPNGVKCAVVVVPGGHPTPIRAKRDGPKHVKINRYYVRKPGPASEEARTPEEWNRIIQRCIRNRRDDLLDQIRAIMEGGTAAKTPLKPDTLKKWTDDSTKHLFGRVKSEMKGKNFYEFGYWTFSYRVVGEFKQPALKGLLKHLDEAGAKRVTGWPPWHVYTRPQIAPKPVAGVIECWLNDGQDRQPAHADFWRASPDGCLFLLSGYDEDEADHGEKPGTFFDVTLPMWRVGERLLHAARLANIIVDGDSDVEVLIRWAGLRNRKLAMWAARDRYPFWDDFETSHNTSATDAVESSMIVSASSIEPQLPELVTKLTAPLYEAFGFYEPSQKMIQSELRRMTKRDY